MDIVYYHTEIIWKETIWVKTRETIETGYRKVLERHCLANIMPNQDVQWMYNDDDDDYDYDTYAHTPSICKGRSQTVLSGPDWLGRSVWPIHPVLVYNIFPLHSIFCCRPRRVSRRQRDVTVTQTSQSTSGEEKSRLRNWLNTFDFVNLFPKESFLFPKESFSFPKESL